MHIRGAGPAVFLKNERLEVGFCKMKERKLQIAL